MVILLSLYNAILVPLEFAFTNLPPSFDALNYVDYVIDALFFLDVFLNFRTIYFDPKTEEPISDSKKIAINYVFKGRFIIDICASFPFDEIYNSLSSGSTNKNLKFLRMMKLIRLLRLGRMITYLKMNQSFKFGVKFIQLIFLILIVIHFNACTWQYIYS